MWEVKISKNWYLLKAHGFSKRIIASAEDCYLFGIIELKTSLIYILTKKGFDIMCALPITVLDLDQAAIILDSDKIYGEESRLIRSCLKKYPENTNRDVVAMKCGLIDITNSTNISRYKKFISVVQLTEILLAIKNFDLRLSKGDLTLVDEIARVSKKIYNINLFSFASKYCCYHNMFVYGRDDYAIYDTIIKDNLPNYIVGVSAYKIDKMRSNIDYLSYVGIIDLVLKNNNIQPNGYRRKLDNLIWYKNR